MPGVEDLFAGAVLGVALQLLSDAIKHAKAETKKFKPKLENLERTVKLLIPKVIEMEQLHQELMDESRGEIRVLHGQLKKARELVSVCSQIPRWDKVERYRCTKRLVKLDSSLQKILNVEFQAAQTVDILRIFSEVTKINKKLDRMNLPDKNYCGAPSAAANEELSNHNGKATEVNEESSDPGTAREGMCNSPKTSFEFITKERRKGVKGVLEFVSRSTEEKIHFSV